MSLRLIAEDFIDPEKIPLIMPLLDELVTKTRAEKGCISYEVCKDLKDPTHIIFIEEWVDYGALDHHVASEHFQRIVPQLDQYSIKASVFTHMERLF